MGRLSRGEEVAVQEEAVAMVHGRAVAAGFFDVRLIFDSDCNIKRPVEPVF